MSKECEYQKFAEEVVDLMSSFTDTHEETFQKILKLIFNDKKYPKLSLRFDQNCGNFS